MKLESRWSSQILYRELLHEQGGESRACATCKRVEDKETLQPRALPVPGHPSDLDINNLPAPVIAVPPFPEIHPSNPPVFDVLFFFFTSLLLIRERLFGKVGTSHTFCPFGPPPCPRTVLPQASCISIRFLQTKVNCVKVWSWNAEIWFKKNNAFCIYPKTAQRRDVLGNTSPEDREISRRREFCTTIPEKFFNLRVYAMCMTSAWILSLGMVFVDTLPWECIGKGPEGFCWGGC